MSVHANGIIDNRNYQYLGALAKYLQVTRSHLIRHALENMLLSEPRYRYVLHKRVGRQIVASFGPIPEGRKCEVCVSIPHSMKEQYWSKHREMRQKDVNLMNEAVGELLADLHVMGVSV